MIIGSSTSPRPEAISLFPPGEESTPSEKEKDSASAPKEAIGIPAKKVEKLVTLINSPASGVKLILISAVIGGS